MPLALALAFTASSSETGRRMFSEAAFGSISNRIGLKPDKSYSVRSAVSTNSSASASLRSGGRGLRCFFIVRDLLLMHVAGADGPELRLAVDLSQHEHHEHIATGSGFADSAHPRFLGERIRRNCRRPGKDLLDLCAGYAMLSAFGPVSIVPIETCDFHQPAHLHLSTQMCM